MAFHRHRIRRPWMTLNSHFALNTVFRVESFSVGALVLRHDCFTIDGDAYIVSSKDVSRCTVCGFWRYKCNSADIRQGSLLRWCYSAVVKNASFLFRSLHLPYEVPDWLYIVNLTRLRAASWQHCSCYMCMWGNEAVISVGLLRLYSVDHCWFSEANTDVDNAEMCDASALSACKSACLGNSSCTGVDWRFHPVLCGMSGPWSGKKNVGGALGVTHYNLIRSCNAGGNILIFRLDKSLLWWITRLSTT